MPNNECFYTCIDQEANTWILNRIREELEPLKIREIKDGVFCLHYVGPDNQEYLKRVYFFPELKDMGNVIGTLFKTILQTINDMAEAIKISEDEILTYYQGIQPIIPYLKQKKDLEQEDNSKEG